MTTEVIAEFADGEYRFFMPMPQVVTFERDHGSILDFWGKLSESTGIDDNGAFHFVGTSGPPTGAIRDLIRLALIGGDHGMKEGSPVDMDPIVAKHLVDDYVFPARPLNAAAALAFRIVDAAVRGVQLKKKMTPEEASPSPSDAGPSSQTAEP